MLQKSPRKSYIYTPQTLDFVFSFYLIISLLQLKKLRSFLQFLRFESNFIFLSALFDFLIFVALHMPQECALLRFNEPTYWPRK